MLNKGAFALEIVRGDPELTADCRVTLNRGDRIGSLDCICLFDKVAQKHQVYLLQGNNSLVLVTSHSVSL